MYRVGLSQSIISLHIHDLFATVFDNFTNTKFLEHTRNTPEPTFISDKKKTN